MPRRCIRTTGASCGIMAAARLGMAALADGDGLSAAEDPADTIQGALDRWRDDFNARPATGINVKMAADHFLLQIGIRSAIFGMEANAERAEEFDASAGNPADGPCPVSLRFVKGAAIPARSASQSRVDTGSTSRAPGPCPGGPSARIHPAHHLQRWQVHSAGRLNGAGRSQWRVHDLHRGLYSTRRSRRNHSPERGALHFGQCAGLLLPLRPPSSVGCCLQAGCSTDSPPPACPLNCHPPPRAFVTSLELECSRSRTRDNCLARVRSGIPCPASAASGRSCLPVLSGRSSHLGLEQDPLPNIR